jgi:hypothetical protein
MERKSFKNGFAKLCAAFQVSATEDQTAVYYENLRGLTDEQWQAVVSHVCKTETFTGKLPAIATLLKAAMPNPKAQAVEAWDYLQRLKAQSKRSANYDPEIGTIYNLPKAISENPLLDKLVRHLGGWQDFCSRQLTDWDWKKFKEAFESYASDPVFSQALQAGNQPKALNKNEESE